MNESQPSHIECSSADAPPRASEKPRRPITIDNSEVAVRLAHFTERLEAGDNPNPNELFVDFPEIKDELQECLDALAFVVHATRNDDSPPNATIGTDGPKQLGDFRLLREIGSGGMGVVYEAEEISLGRRVALKVLPFAAMLDKRQLERFRNEARAAAILQHPSIVRVYSVGLDRGVHFYTMELVDGQDLSELVRGLATKTGNSPDAGVTDDVSTHPVAALSTHRSSDRHAYFDAVARIGCEAAMALQYAHELGVVHRDIKPANLLIDHEGMVRITDFGLATTQTDASLTMSGDLLGTLRYMSPEQAGGTNSIVDHRTDIYSLGLTLYELLVLRPAFDGNDRHALLRKKELSEPRSLRHGDRQIPKDLETIITKAISRDRDARYKTAREFSEDLQRFRENRPIIARRVGHAELTRRWIVRNRIVSALTATVMTLLVALTITSGMNASRISKEAAAKEMELYGYDMRRANNAIQRGEFMTAEQILFDWMPDSGEIDHRGWEWSYLWNASHDPSIDRTFRYPFRVFNAEFVGDDKLAVSWLFGGLLIWDLNRDAAETPLFSFNNYGIMKIARIPESNRCISGHRTGEIVEWDLDRGRKMCKIRVDLPTNESKISALSISEDNNLVAVCAGIKGHGHVGVWNRVAGEWIYKANDFSNVCYVEIGSDNVVYVAERNTDNFRAIDFTSGVVVAEFDIDVSEIRGMTTTADRKRLVVIANSRLGNSTVAKILIWDIEKQRVIVDAPIGSTPLSLISISNDDSMVAVGDETGTICLLDANTLATLQTKKAHAGEVSDLSFSMNDSKIASASHDGYARIWDVKKLLKGSNVRIELDERYLYGFGSEFVDNETAVSLNQLGQAIFWDTRTGKLVVKLQLPFTDTDLHQLAVSHDRTTIAVTHGYADKRVSSSAQLCLIDSMTRTIKWETDLPSGLVYSVSSFSPDDRFLAVSAKRSVIIFETESGRILKQLNDGQPADDGSYFKPATFSPDGRWLACGTTSGQIHMFSVPDFARKRVIEVATVCEDIQFSPDSREMAIVDLENRIRLYSTESGSELQDRFPPSPSFLVFVRYSADGKRLITGGHDGMLRVWHAESGAELLSLNMPGGYFPSGNFSPDGNAIIVSNGPDAVVFAGSQMKNLIPLSKSELKELACSTVSGQVRRADAKQTSNAR